MVLMLFLIRCRSSSRRVSFSERSSPTARSAAFCSEMSMTAAATACRSPYVINPEEIRTGNADPSFRRYTDSKVWCSPGTHRSHTAFRSSWVG